MFSLSRFKPVGTHKFPAPLLHWSVGPPFADAANYTLRFSIRKTKKAARGGSESRAASSVKILLSTLGKVLTSGNHSAKRTRLKRTYVRIIASSHAKFFLEQT